MRIYEFIEDFDHKAQEGQKSAIPGNAPPPPVEVRKKLARKKVEHLFKKKK